MAGVSEAPALTARARQVGPHRDRRQPGDRQRDLPAAGRRRAAQIGAVGARSRSWRRIAVAVDCAVLRGGRQPLRQRPAVRILPARAAFGRFVGFEVGWMMWFARVTSHASVVNGLTLALAFYWPALATGIPRAATITALTLVLTWINVRGIKQSSWVVNALTIGKLAAAGDLHPRRHLVHRSRRTSRPCRRSRREQVSRRADPADLRVRRLRGHRRARRRSGQPAQGRAVRLRGHADHRLGRDVADLGRRHRRAAGRGRHADAARRRRGDLPGRGRRGDDLDRLGRCR